MAERILILTPASLVGQWRDEMESKFGLEFMTSQDRPLHRDPGSFWGHARIIASVAAARREENAKHLLGRQFDLIIVDEAHHLKNRSSKNWKLIDSLQKRFLLLLSATPIQNSLVELYNLLTLLKPGIFKTEKEFRSIYVTPGNPRVPANRGQLQELMRDVMIRNTRALVDVRLPPRHASTVAVEPATEELDCYQELSRRIRGLPEDQRVQNSMALHHLIEAAGSSPRAASSSLAHFLKPESPSEWHELGARYGRLSSSAKSDALLSLLKTNPAEKKIVFARFRETLHMLGDCLRGHGVPFACFEGALGGAEKDLAIERFREEVPVLLSTESGGEGRNLQFCNTVVNFDLPWNPQLIEQRIGRIHRIGQTREVFVFNLTVRHTAEEHMLRILDEKIHMFELVVGEIQSILGEMEEGPSFASLVFSAWVAQTEEDRQNAFNRLGDKLAAAMREYAGAKALDDEVFGEECGLA
jgi:SNF2 family DNA or RNA helicase